MKFLLDTHVWLWSLIAPGRLSSATQSALIDPQHTLYLSPISVWEAMLLIERGRIQVDSTPSEWVALALTRSPLREASMTHAIAVRSRTISLPHQDPADRFIAATALELDLTLITADHHLLNQPQLPTWPATE